MSAMRKPVALAAPRILGVGERPPAAATSRVKRTLDLVLGALGCLAAAPIVGVAMACVRLDSSGPVFYRATRVGLGGRPFAMHKLRTMHVGAEQRLAQLQHANLGGELMIRIPDDPRVTRVGRWLRRTGIDELPQLWNVVRGEMSIVGPRPWAVNEVRRIGPAAPVITSVRPGITGLWQVEAWGDPSPDVRIALDRRYVEAWSFGLDVRLLARTPVSMLRNRFMRRVAVGADAAFAARQPSVRR